MKARQCVTTGCALVFLGAFTAAPAAATPLDRRTTFTVSTPFALPGVTLPAGSYIFRLADDTRGRDVVQVLSADGRTTYAMLAVLRTTRSDPLDKALVLFMETTSGLPIAVRSWWYPAASQGYEFMYPRRQLFAPAGRSPRNH